MLYVDEGYMRPGCIGEYLGPKWMEKARRVEKIASKIRPLRQIL
jgi:hypothetical protein